MDAATRTYYQDHAKELAEWYDTCTDGIASHFSISFSTGMRVLEIGCGSGRDLARLVEAGFEAFGVEPCAAFRHHAETTHPCLRGRIADDELPTLSTVKTGSFDGVLCSAVLMHLPEEQVFDAVYAIKRALKPHGRLLISVPLVDGLPDEEDRDNGGRLFNGIVPDRWQLIFARLGFQLIGRWDNRDSLGRADRTWSTMLFDLSHPDGGRSLDRIESVLNRDHKQSTYKLALFRALAEIAISNYSLAIWDSNSMVSLPITALAERWVRYYWPIVASQTHIPQNYGRPIAFRNNLSELIQYYDRAGGLNGFAVDCRYERLSKEAKRLYGRLLRNVKQTIKVGPVRYAGGGGTEAQVFSYDKATRSVVMDASLWRELAMMGPWIQDACILRWAELTTRISNGVVQASQIVDLLLTVPNHDRDVGDARQTYGAITDLRCIWTDVAIGRKKFEVDHAIPFALWKCNDLWNLFPALARVNNQKRDRLPTRDLLDRRKGYMIYCWEILHAAHPNRFEYEMKRFGGAEMGRTGVWHSRLYGKFVEAVEMTSLQRGMERWDPAAGVGPVASSSASSAEIINIKDWLVENPPSADRYVTHVPYYDIRATGGVFGLEQYVDESDEPVFWYPLDDAKPDLFVIQVVGDSMGPEIPNGSFCLFRAGDALGGTRNGKIVLVRSSGLTDPDTGYSVTVKRYHSEKTDDGDGGWRQIRIILEPLNQAHKPIELTPEHREDFAVIGEFVRVVPLPQKVP